MNRELTDTVMTKEEAEQWGRVFESIYESMDWLEEHREDLRQRHQDRWVAIKDKGVIAEATTFEELHRHLRDHGIEPSHVLRELVRSGSKNPFSPA